jgi:hypothetical protein
MAFKLSLTSWSLPACTLREAAGISSVLGIGALDVGYFYGPALDKQALLSSPERVADEVRELGVALPCLYHLFGNTLPAGTLRARRTSTPTSATSGRRRCSAAAPGSA